MTERHCGNPVAHDAHDWQMVGGHAPDEYRCLGAWPAPAVEAWRVLVDTALIERVAALEATNANLELHMNAARTDLGVERRQNADREKDLSRLRNEAEATAAQATTARDEWAHRAGILEQRLQTEMNATATAQQETRNAEVMRDAAQRGCDRWKAAFDTESGAHAGCRADRAEQDNLIRDAIRERDAATRESEATAHAATSLQTEVHRLHAVEAENQRLRRLLTDDRIMWEAFANDLRMGKLHNAGQGIAARISLIDIALGDAKTAPA